MQKELEVKNNNIISIPEKVPVTVNLNDQATYIENNGTIELTNKTFNISTTVNGNTITSNISPINNFYNLFVLDGEEFAKGYFIIKRENCLKFLDKEIEKNYSIIDKNSIDVCINYPCLFLNKNKSYKKAGNNQLVYFGYLANIEIIDEGCKFFFSITSSLEQQIFNNNTSHFNLKSSRGENELDRIHWSIKNKNLIEAIHTLGFKVAAY